MAEEIEPRWYREAIREMSRRNNGNGAYLAKDVKALAEKLREQQKRKGGSCVQ